LYRSAERTAARPAAADADRLGVGPRAQPAVARVLDHLGQVAARRDHRRDAGELRLEHHEAEAFAQLGTARTAMNDGAIQQGRHILAEPEEIHRAGEIGLCRPLAERRAMPLELRRLPSVHGADDVERRVETAGAQPCDRVEQQVESFAGNDLTDENHASRNLRACRR
jgi:hypothetical protein